MHTHSPLGTYTHAHTLPTRYTHTCTHTHISPTCVGLSGYQAYKYVPYGPVSEVLPYLVRRAHENSSLMHSASALEERKLVKQELWRRIRTLSFV